MQPDSNRSMTWAYRAAAIAGASILAGLALTATGRHLWNLAPKEGDR